MCVVFGNGSDNGYGTDEDNPVVWSLRWTDTGSRIMAAILFLIIYQNIPKCFAYGVRITLLRDSAGVRITYI